ncbi:MAG: hypothetical protein PHT94_03425 [Candidatus Nanoarchaeia archaeon]|nr:hypothetical protein [Candidatus Nanoarchaeia archaeon]
MENNKNNKNNKSNKNNKFNQNYNKNKDNSINKKSELSMEVIIIAAVSVLVLVVTIVSIISMYKKNNSQYIDQKEEIDGVLNDKKCVNVLSLGSRKCVEISQYPDLLDKGWVKINGNFEDCENKVCIECPSSNSCSD